MVEITNDVQASRALAELQRRRLAYPLRYAKLWHNEKPRTSQRRALAQVADPTALMSLVLGGNRTGKSELLAMWVVASAAGRDAYVVEPGGRRVYWVREWLRENGLPEDLVQPTPGRVWVASPTFGAAVEQIRPKIRRWCPAGTYYKSWDSKTSEAEAHLPGGGVIVSKAYAQYDSDSQTWEGANIRALALDEQPNSYENLTAGLSRLVDQRGKCMMSVTPLRGKGDWLFKKLVQAPPAWLRLAWLHGCDNPFIPQDWRELMLSAMPAWQRASRDVGAFTQPEGACFPFDRGIHVLRPFPIPAEWIRWNSTDWGGRAPHVTWTAEVKVPFLTPQGLQLRAGDLIVYRELAVRRTTAEPALSDRQLLELAKALEVDGGENYNVSTFYRVADSENPGGITEAAEQGWWVEGAAKEAGSVMLGLQLLELLFQTIDPITLEKAQPRLYIFDSCPTTIEECEGLRWADVKEGQQPKPDPRCPDHAPDTLRYMARYRQLLGFQ